jgi:GntR family transcriptional regulator
MAGMDPQPTAVFGPVQLRIADDLRMKIERGDLAPGQRIPSANDLAAAWKCSPSSGRAAINLLRKQGLVTVDQGQRPTVRIPPRRSCLRQATSQTEKDRVLMPEAERKKSGSAEDNLMIPLSELEFSAKYRRIPATPDLAEAFGVDEGTEILRRDYETVHKSNGVLEQQSVSFIPVHLIAGNPDLLDSSREPWPGGTQHQLYTVGVEVARMDTEVSAAMPTTVEVQRWGLSDGVPLLCGRKLAVDTAGRVVEISEARYPADRTTMFFSLDLKPWENVDA